MTYDPFKPETGLLDDNNVTIVDAEFVNRLEANDSTKLELHLTVLDEDGDGGEQVLYFGCGKGWEQVDKGQRAVREDGAEKNFHANTKAGELMGSIVKLMGSDKVLDKEMRTRLSAHPTGFREAGFWKGLRLHLASETRKGGSEIGDYSVLVATGFNGTVGGKAAGKAAGATKKAAAKKDTPAPAVSGGVTAEVRAKLDEIADASADHDSFMEAAFAQVPEASSDADVKAAVADDGDGSIWADAVARYEALAGADA